MKTNALITIFLILLSFTSYTALEASGDFYAYHTKVQHSSTDYLGKYSDVIVVIDELGKLEFTRQTGYQPLWKTNKGSYLVDDFFPGRDNDYIFYYNYVRLIENSSDKIVVHWRYIPDIKTLDKSITEKDPLNQHGFLGVVHELFTIYPDGKVERKIKDARGTTYEEWQDPYNAITQTIQLQDNGINYGKVNWGIPEEEDEEEDETEGEELEENFTDIKGLAVPKMHWRMDEGIYGHEGTGS